MTEHDDWRGTHRFLARPKRASERRSDAEHVEEIVRNDARRNAIGHEGSAEKLASEGDDANHGAIRYT